MESCPTCKARYKGGTVCYRCKSELTILLKIEKEALSRIQNSKYHLEKGNYDKALNEVEKSLFLLKTEEGRYMKAHILACKDDFSKAAEVGT